MVTSTATMTEFMPSQTSNGFFGDQCFGLHGLLIIKFTLCVQNETASRFALQTWH